MELPVSVKDESSFHRFLASGLRLTRCACQTQTSVMVQQISFTIVLFKISYFINRFDAGTKLIPCQQLVYYEQVATILLNDVSGVYCTRDHRVSVTMVNLITV